MFSDDSLLKEDFDPIAFLKHTLRLPSVEAEHAKLQRCTDIIDGHIRCAVANNYDEMLEQVDTTCKVVKETERLKSNVTTLSSALVRLHHTIEVPFNAIQSTGTELRNASNALDTLRAVQKLLAAVAKLPEANAKNVDIHRTARKIKEIDELLSMDNLSGIHVVDKALAEVTALAAATRTRAQEMLRSGLISGRQADISTALHALTTLNVGGRVVSNYLTEAKRDTLKSLIALDAQQISMEIAEQSDINRGKELVFTHLERSLSEVSSRCALVMLLMRTVQKQQQTPSPTGVSSAVPSSSSASTDEISSAFNDYGASIASHLIERLTKLGKKSNINGVLVTEFPRYSRIISKFTEATEPLLILGGQFPTAAAWQAKVVEDIEKLFVSHVAEKQRDKLQQIITRLNALVPRQGADGTIVDIAVDPLRPVVPAQANPIDTRALTKVISADMTLGRQDPALASFYINTTTNTLTQLLERLREGSSRVPLNFSPSAQLTVGQLFHIALTNVATGIYSDVSSVVSLTAGGSDTMAAEQYNEATIHLKQTLDGLQSFIVNTTRNFLTSAGSTLWNAVKVFLLEDGDAAALEAKVRAVMTRQLLFFIKGTPQYEANRLDVCNVLLLKGLSLACMLRQGEVDAARLKVLPTALSLLATFERLPSATRSNFRSITASLSSSSTSSPSVPAYFSSPSVLASLHPMLQIAALFAIQPEGSGVLLHVALKDSLEHAVNTMALLIGGGSGSVTAGGSFMLSSNQKSSFLQLLADLATNTSNVATKGFDANAMQQLASCVQRLQQSP